MKRKSSARSTIVVVSLGAAALLPSCKPASQTSSFADLPSEGDSGVVTQEAFYIKAHSDMKITTYMHQFNNFSKACEILSTDSAGKDIKCLLNVREQDLYYYGLKFVINVPRSMCKFFEERPYYYFNYEPGFGPSTINVSYRSDTDTVTSCSIDGVAGTISGKKCSYPGGVNCEGSITVGGAPTCIYNYTLNTIPGPNCCFGNYAYTLTQSDGTKSSVSTVEGSWGGDWGSCLSGPAVKDSTWLKSSTGFPLTLTKDVETAGLNKSFTIPAPINIYGGAMNVFAANMWDWSGYSAGSHSTTPPAAVYPVTDRSGTSFPLYRRGNPSYEYRCLDQAGEVIHRIRLYVNEWDTSEQFTTYGSSSGASGTPNSTGSDGTDCEAGGSVTSSCNDFLDWDNLSNTYPSEDAP